VNSQGSTFYNFAEFWRLTRSLSTEQREIIFNNLSSKERKKLKYSYTQGGWEDLFFRDLLDKFHDKIIQEWKFDLLNTRCQVIKGKNICINKILWQHISNFLDQFHLKHTYYLIGGMKVEEFDKENLVLSSVKKGN